MVRGHDGSKSVAVGDVHDYILLEFEKRVYNSTLQQFRNNDSLPDLNVTDIRLVDLEIQAEVEMSFMDC